MGSSSTRDGSGVDAATAAADLPRRLVGGRFRIERVLGDGRLSPVYLATSLPLARNVALRLVGAGAASAPAFYEAFYAGVQAAGKLNHPALARVLDCGEEPDGTLFLVTEYVAGTSLRKLVAEQGTLGPHRIAVIFHQVLSALAAAHDAGVVHRAVSPDNLLVVPSRTDDGAPTDLAKLCDLPLASLVELDDRGQCASGAFFRAGAARLRAESYLAPEQERGDAVDGRADLYALGAALYELLAGAPPYAEIDAHSRAARRRTSAPPRPRERRTGVDETLERICMKALAHDPDARYASARAMRHDLRTLLVEDRSGRYVLQKNASVAPPPAVASNPGAEPSGVSTLSLAAVEGRLARRPRTRGHASKRAKLRAELSAWLGPTAVLAVVAVFVTSAFLSAHPRRRDDSASSKSLLETPVFAGACDESPEGAPTRANNASPAASSSASDGGAPPRNSGVERGALH